MPRGGDITRRRLVFGVTTLLRKTPLLGLRAEWIELDENWLNVPAFAQKGRHGEKRALSIPLPLAEIRALMGTNWAHRPILIHRQRDEKHGVNF